MKKYLITGCAGFIGSNFVYYMLKKYDDILLVNLDKLTYAGNLENLKGVEGDTRHVFVQGDICDKELVAGLFAKYDFDYVINFAAESHVDRSIANPEIFVQTNVMGRSTFSRGQRKRGMTLPLKHGKKERSTCRFLTMRSMGHLVQMDISWRRLPSIRIARTLLPRRVLIILSRHSMIPMVCPLTLHAAPITMVRTSSQRS